MKKIIVITNSFPYLHGEQFLETEVCYYKNYTNVEFAIMPSHSGSTKRSIDKSIKINSNLISVLSIKNIICVLPKIFISKVFYKELFAISNLNFKILKDVFRSVLKYFIYRDRFISFLKHEKEPQAIMFYTYWNTEITYALQSLKYKYKFKLISRIHGTDIYEERRETGYMPLKRQFISNIDRIFTITHLANEYLYRKYNFSADILEIGRLGVEDNNIVTKSTNKGMLHIVSCSSMIEIKQLHKIIYALNILGAKLPATTFSWTHLGDGLLYKELKAMVDEKLGELDNVHVYFKGEMPNNQVFEFYKNESIDVFVNVSKSEGVPVSIMEAMSCHIPIVAPNIGGVSDMIEHGKNGYLLSENFDNKEIVSLLNNIDFYKNVQTRDNSYGIFLDKYNAKNNYSCFLEKITDIKWLKI